MPRLVLILALLTACHPRRPVFGTVEDDGPSTDVVGDCDPVVSIPSGLLSGDAPAPDDHEPTYGADPTPFQVHYTWPGRDPSTQAALAWRTDTDTLATVVELGTAADFQATAERYEGKSFLFGGAELGTGAERIHEVRICEGLSPDTSYSYRVGGDEGWSDTFTFTTPPSPGTFETFRVAVSGDSRGSYTTWGALLAAMNDHEPDFFMFSGDMVEMGSNQAEWDAWFESGGDILAEKAIVPAHGNHEFMAQAYFAQWALPGNEQWFSIEYGDLQIVVLNTNGVDRAETIRTDQVAFLHNELGESTARWKVALHHEPPYATCSTHRSSIDVREAWSPVFDTYGVDLDFAGHNHIYERSVPIRDDVEDADGTIYIVTGGAGAPLYTKTDDEWFGAVAEPTQHFLVVDFGPEAAVGTAYDLAGNVIDTWEVSK